MVNGSPRSSVRREVFRDNKPASFVADKLAALLGKGFVRFEHQPTDGRPREVWFAVDSLREKRFLREKGAAEGAFHVNHVSHVGGTAGKRSL